MSDLGSRAIVMANFFVCHDKPQTVSWLAAVVELCHHVLWMGEWTGVHPPGMDSSAMLRHWRCLPAGHCTVAQLTCEPCMYRHAGTGRDTYATLVYVADGVLRKCASADTRSLVCPRVCPSEPGDHRSAKGKQGSAGVGWETPTEHCSCGQVPPTTP